MIHQLMRHSVDYAGLFPPASLSLSEVVRNYAIYVGSADAWMLARLIIPLKQLTQFVEFAESQPPAGRPWNVSCLVLGPESDRQAFQSAGELIQEFNRQHGDLASIDSVETKADRPQTIQDFAEVFPKGISVYWELPHSLPLDEFLASLANAGQRGKIRTGGIQADMIATTADVARFVDSFARAKVAFKATAGLHHPIRASYALTYEPTSPCATMHGFLNLFFASAAAWNDKVDISSLEQILNEHDPNQFHFEPHSIRWRDVLVSGDEIRATRDSFLISFGSCSFTEPLSDLRSLGVLSNA